uniref:Uncharacterized protein n=1 Tax=Rhizophora mucronata TaxID=61149 RepID=A0A2P2J5C5_RHIMU
MPDASGIVGFGSSIGLRQVSGSSRWPLTSLLLLQFSSSEFLLSVLTFSWFTCLSLFSESLPVLLLKAWFSNF